MTTLEFPPFVYVNINSLVHESIDDGDTWPLIDGYTITWKNHGHVFIVKQHGERKGTLTFQQAKKACVELGML